MYSTKKNILQLAALLKAYDINQVVISPGSRNAPITETLTKIPGMNCFSVTDERSAAFFALGIIQKSRKPAAICCTSGSALLNYGPAIAEAFYQELPLVVISADRPQAWIGQMDGQTLPQAGSFNTILKKSVQLPEVNTTEDEWYCNRLINETLIEMTRHGNGPVHINVPISEPMFEFTEPCLPDVRIINTHKKVLQNTGYDEKYNKDWYQSSKRMILIGQLPPSHPADEELRVFNDTDCVILTENLSNIHASGQAIKNFDAMLYSLPKEEWEAYAPDLLITFGGHIISKRIKELIRAYPPKKHYHFTCGNAIPDLFKSLTDIIEADLACFLRAQYCKSPINKDDEKPYFQQWKKVSRNVNQKLYQQASEFPFSALYAVKEIQKALPAQPASLLLGNSSSVRYSQLFSFSAEVKVYSNRGVNGIDGSMSAAVGFAAVNNDEPTYLIIGDLSFFYDMNALWNKHINNNLRILLINNGGGEIFHALPNLNKISSLGGYVANHHTTSAKAWAEACGFSYLQANNKDSFNSCIVSFMKRKTDKPILFEVTTSLEEDTNLLRTFYHGLK